MYTPYMHASEKLNGDNYHDWKQRVKLILMKEGLWKIVDGKRKAPTGKEGDSTALEKWENDCENAYAMICLMINTPIMQHVENLTTASKVWKKLAEVYEKKGIAHELYLHQQLLNFKKGDDDTMEQHIK